MKTSNDLRELLTRIDSKGYPAYKDTRGSYQFEGYVLSIDHVQGDPFAAPSKVSIHVPEKTAGFPSDLYEEKHKQIALQDYLLRKFARESETFNFKAKGSGKSGLMSVSRCGQEILERTACELKQDGTLIIRMEIGFPANGRTINSRELIKILFEFLPGCVKKSLYYSSLNKKDVQKNAELAEDQQFIREQLPKLGLAAFVANGSILPRESGISNRPMKQAIAFQSPKSMELSLELPNYGKITGMGIRQGITLIVGGGYHGKSTLLKALELGVYNHISGDGREYVITNHTAVKIRAEDGRSIKQSDISMFINNLPNGKDTVHFCTQDASGSTSQAANMIEAMEAGAETFLIDEDTSATNFMIRDELMQRVVNRDCEPITPFIDRVEELYERFGISTVLVAGSCGSYFHKAGAVIQMNRYVPADVTELAKKEASQFPLLLETLKPAEKPDFQRILFASKAGGRDRMKIKTMGKDALSIDRETVDLRYVEQLADPEQVVMLGQILKYVLQNMAGGKKTVCGIVEEICHIMDQKGMPGIYGGRYLPSGLAMPRKQEIFACLNRYRK